MNDRKEQSGIFRRCRGCGGIASQIDRCPFCVTAELELQELSDEAFRLEQEDDEAAS
jgi:hypothetical protein